MVTAFPRLRFGLASGPPFPGTQETIAMSCRTFSILCCLTLAGCGTAQPPAPPPPAGPTYAEALTIYNQELDLLERLKTSARQAEAAHEEKLTRLKTSLLLGDAVKDLQVVNDLAVADNLLNDEDVAKAKAAAEKARNQLGESGAKAPAEMEKLVKEHDSRMAELNKSITEQEAKVAKALQMKDDAEKRK